MRLNDSADKRKDLAQRLRTAGCDVNLDGSDWLQAGDFSAPKVPGGPLGRRVPSRSTARGGNWLDARYLSRSSGSDYIQLINRGPEALIGLNALNERDFPGQIDGFPIERLPAGKSVNLLAMQFANDKNTIDLVVVGRTEGGEEIREPLFLDLNG